jgi:hypothetical protein
MAYYTYSSSSSPHASEGTDDVSGFVQGTSVQLTIGSSTYTGSLNANGSLDLSVQNTDGSISVDDFTPATVDAYNAAIAPLQQLAEQWDNAYWGTQAAKACILTVGTHDVRVFVGAGGAATCRGATSLGYTEVTTYIQTDSVLCLGTASPGGVTVAVADDGGDYYGGAICQDVNDGTFPSVAPPAP